MYLVLQHMVCCMQVMLGVALVRSRVVQQHMQAGFCCWSLLLADVVREGLAGSIERDVQHAPTCPIQRKDQSYVGRKWRDEQAPSCSCS